MHDDFRQATGLSEDSWVCRTYSQSLTAGEDLSPPTDEVKRMSLLLKVVGRLRAQLNTWFSFETPIERALLQYKLGYEVMLPDSRKRIPKGTHELKLQKELCKFLLERNVFTFGTQFGQSEVDLMQQQPGDTLVIEAKIYRRSASSSSLRANLAQLQNYMDQQEFTSRGVLVIYNLTNTLLLPRERRWIRGRYWILPINLGTDTPSRRKRSLMFEEGRDGELLQVVKNDASVKKKAPKKAAKKKTPKKAAKKKAPKKKTPKKK